MQLDLAQHYLPSIPTLHLAEDTAQTTLPRKSVMPSMKQLEGAKTASEGPDIPLAEAFLNSLELALPIFEIDLALQVGAPKPSFVPAPKAVGGAVDNSMAKLGRLEKMVSNVFKNWLPRQRKKVDKAEPTGSSYKEFLVPSKSHDYDLNFYDFSQVTARKTPPSEHEASLMEAGMGRHGKRAREEANEAFQRMHPELDASITRSKLRNLQKDLFDITTKVPSLEMATVALAWVYFEMLLKKGHIIKSNRKLFGGACLVLAYKFNQDGCDVNGLQQLARCIQNLDRKDRLNLAALQEAEVKVLVFLEFGLNASPDRVLHHLQRIHDGNFPGADNSSVADGVGISI